MLRSIAKTSLACAYTWTGASRLIGGGSAPTPFIVGYHRVVENFERSKANTIPSMLISAAMLERHIDFLAKRFLLVSLDDIGLYLESGRPFRRPAAAITFDDGYGDVYHHAYPLLKRKGIPAAIFVVTGLMGTGRPQIFDRFYFLLRLLTRRGLPLTDTIAAALQSVGVDTTPFEEATLFEEEPFRLMTLVLNTFPQQQIEAALSLIEKRVPLPEAELKEMEPMTWEMVQAMQRNGMTIGSHTVSHRLLTTENSETVRNELIASRQTLEKKLGASVNHFAYPDGRFNPAVVRNVKSAGYRYAYAICQARDRNFPHLTIPRKMFWERSCLNVLGRFSSSVMNCHAHWVFDRKDCCDHDHFTIRAEQNGEPVN